MVTRSSVERSFSERAHYSLNGVARKLFHLMDEKESNLSICVDVLHADELLKLADLLGPQMVVLKTHIDMLLDYTPQMADQLVELSHRHHFLIFEDRKFADIGNTVYEQYRSGLYRIASWADIVTVHALGGQTTIEGLKKGKREAERALLLLAQLSAKGNLLTKGYAKKTVELALSNLDFVIGFIAQEKLTNEPALIHMTPGVHLEATRDQLGQSYITVDQAITKNKSDIIIVGRAITKAQDPLEQAKKYRQMAFQCYKSKL